MAIFPTPPPFAYLAAVLNELAFKGNIRYTSRQKKKAKWR
jgi:hypothetical protein